MKYGWDVELKEPDRQEWREWYKKAEEIDEVKTPRALNFHKVTRETTCTLHMFCDASENDYGACAYLRQEFGEETVGCRLAVGKGSVTPLKAQYIYRLELMGALNAVR